MSTGLWTHWSTGVYAAYTPVDQWVHALKGLVSKMDGDAHANSVPDSIIFSLIDRSMTSLLNWPASMLIKRGTF